MPARPGQGFSALQRAEIAEMAARSTARRTAHPVSVLFNEPKLLKCCELDEEDARGARFSALQRAEIAEIAPPSVQQQPSQRVSVLFNEPKLLKFAYQMLLRKVTLSFSALQRAEIAEIVVVGRPCASPVVRFSALQRAEIAEMLLYACASRVCTKVSVLFNEPKLLK